ncbi:DUF1868 domain-containing protein [Rhizobium deserti]|uniref:DUF1868 domain-containing protein n=1 Tax=Rhizobium deserti TaxID=2547961 RepID=A0A4R5UFZ1_9HYPH|nr:DUF1868 domain-containing protein [Rhizobium deserti]TDK34397.1 DUF1868 domain-containing protein [Rhizobium deserti]
MNPMSFSPELLDCSKSYNGNPPPHLGTRYRSKGGFLPEPGNTIVCHVEKDTETQRALIEVREKYLAMPEAPQFLFTPITSLHMTLFQGIIEGRRQPNFWPHDIPLDTPIEETTGIMAARLEALSLCEPFQVAVTKARPSGLIVDGATDGDRKIMRAWRDAFADLLGYRHPDHDDYLFHITFAYVIERLEDQALPRWQAMLNEAADTIAQQAPILDLRPPAFCIFEDMNHFHEVLIFDFEE